MRPKWRRLRRILLHARLERFGPAMIKPSQKWLDEDYLIVDVQSAKGSDGVVATAS